jgi:exopolyphosphatase/guanosine-5'-triphosphate,3'-diphosphate pyrophosphatase
MAHQPYAPTAVRPPMSPARGRLNTHRLGVLDVGSNTVHLLVVHGTPGAHPTPHTSHKAELRLAEHLGPLGELRPEGIAALVATVREARGLAEQARCDELLAFATSALRDATNAAEVLRQVYADTGVGLRVLPGDDEARYTFLAARRWFGWSAGALLVLDIGGGSLELAAGPDEAPAVALSVPLGAGRLTREWFTADPPPGPEIEALRAHARGVLEPALGALAEQPRPDLVVGTSKTIRSLARLVAASPIDPRAPRVLTATRLDDLVQLLSRTRSADLIRLDRVSPARARQLLAGAVVTCTAMNLLELPRLSTCPWALREGVVLHRLDAADRLGSPGAAP